jgi:5'(3')-deoxyribonucleotidase
MGRESIAIDLDDVLAAHAESFIDFSNKQYGTNLTAEDYSDHWVDIWHVDHEEIERRATEFHIPETIAALAAKKEAKEALKKLGTSYNLYIVTARRQNLIDTTKVWLEQHFPSLFKDVHFVPIWEPDNKITKADICKEIGASYLIDDLPRHCNVAAEGGLKAILFGDYGWNRNEKIAKGVIRCKDWSAVLEYFDGRS